MKTTLFKPPYHFFYRKRFWRSFFYVRSMNVDMDFELIHRWVNEPYAHKFWQMQGSLEALKEYYQARIEENITSSFFICHGKKPIALFEVYQVIYTVVGNTYKVKQDDYGIHLLMAPYADLQDTGKIMKHISEKVLSTIVEMLFSYNAVGRIIAEPDSRNLHAHKLAENTGFTFQKEIKLPDKTARLYIYDKKDFHKNTEQQNKIASITS